ncbi:glycoside hydrolase family 38 N-terminal domain-containing protein [Tessaracoccus antarcticus]|uniref:Glycoside hydrolase family 38 N-terminal domain-containing protein n=1 Tax=Tessaracoccus antarcticus TaxID=2479848 RepID=A0A3M0G2H6_9ACTN|nr:hypothetical protein [Tessaracoccus antarcticus]RMB58975.1 hypothetical protein EAX62_12830 [Tessaracoccus antarcticus]
MTDTTLFTLTPASAPPAAGPWTLCDGVNTAVIRCAAQDPSTPTGGALPAVHPGVFDATGGMSSHRVRVHFTVGEATDAVLRLNFSAERGPCPDLEVVLDGHHRGIFHPIVERNDRSVTGEPGPVAGPGTVEVSLPAAWLSPGEHSLDVSTVVDEASAIGDRNGATHDVLRAPREELPLARDTYGSWFGAYLRWNRISLHASEPLTDGPSVTVNATPFFVATPEGDRPLVDLDVTWPAGAPAPVGLTVHWGHHGPELPVPAVPTDRDFGQFRWRFAAPAFDEPVPVRVAGDTLVCAVELTPRRKWDLHLIPHVHLDLGFTDTQGKILELHCRNIDRALDIMDGDPTFRFAVDGSVIAREYTRTRPPRQVQRMMDAISRGDLGVNALHSNALTGLTSLEELYHSTDFALTLPRSNRTNTRYANLTDVPTCTSALPGVLKALGIDGFVGMANHGRAATRTSDDIHLASPVRWRGIDGNQVLAHFADHYSQLRFLAGDPQSIAGGVNGLERFLVRFEREDYLPTDLAVIGTHADNEDIADGDTGFVERWNAVFSYPRFRVSTFDEYLAAVEPLYDRLPVWQGEGGSFWEDGAGAAAAEFGRYRRTQALLPATETLGAAVSAHDAGYRTNRHELDRAWNGLAVGAEHTITWSRGSSHPHAFPVADQLDWKARFVHDAERVAGDEKNRHLSQLAEVLGATGAGFLVFNPHAWTADLDAEIDLPDRVELVDADGPIQVETLSDCAGMRRCRLTLRAMAPHSYRFLPITSALRTLPGGESTNSHEISEKPHATYTARAADATITVGNWSLTLDPATSLPRSLIHGSSGRELLDTGADIRLGQLIRAAGRASHESQDFSVLPEIHTHERLRSEFIENYGTGVIPSALVEESPHLQFIGVKETFDGARLRWLGGGNGLDAVRMDLLLRRDANEMDLEVEFTKAACHDMEAVYVAFPFADADPVLRYDRQLGWVEPARDHAPGASNEWGALTNAIALDGSGGAIHWTAIDAPLWSAGDLVRGTWASEFTVGNSHLFSFVMNNFWPCNTPPMQEGTVAFRYRFGVAESFSPSAASRFARTARVGAAIAEILPLDRYIPGGTAAYMEGSLLDLGADTDTEVQLRQGHDPDEFTLRVVNLVAEARTVTLRVPDGLRSTQGGADPGAVTVNLRGWGDALVPLTRRDAS